MPKVTKIVGQRVFYERGPAGGAHITLPGAMKSIEEPNWDQRCTGMAPPKGVVPATGDVGIIYDIGAWTMEERKYSAGLQLHARGGAREIFGRVQGAHLPATADLASTDGWIVDCGAVTASDGAQVSSLMRRMAMSTLSIG